MPAEPDRPNVVLITSHDLGLHLGCYGVGTGKTPNLDGLAASGLQFNNAVATSPVCSPSRGSLLTGRYPQSNGLIGLTHSPWWWRLDEEEETLPELLGEAGYETHLADFQHVAPDVKRLGFDYRHSADHKADETAGAAREIFADVGSDPIYVQFGFSETHRPFDREPADEDGIHVPDYLEGTTEIREDLARFQAEINYLDQQVGELLRHLEEHGERENTIVVFAVDHGIPYPGAKWWCRDPGTEISLLVDGPDFESAPPVEPVISNVDVLPTLFDALDLSPPDRVEGMSFYDYLTGETENAPREAAFTQFTTGGDESRGVVTEQYILIRNFGGRNIEYPTDADPTSRGSADGPSAGARPYAQLYDRVDDPHNLSDIGDAHPEIVSSLRQRTNVDGACQRPTAPRRRPLSVP
ncbi:sulfatase-like hydrolase/transferase [Halocatena marina]|uniref:sulfatase-like hydrolase/transferase n=1 Tax=Halocatena marina TaxID=2934937 RepID=UPI0022247B44|nr:sulfatase-like hydrolase/transferase [Halocatena marina]